MDFNFAKPYIKEKPKSSIANVILPVLVGGLIGGLLLMCAASYLDLRYYNNTIAQLEEEMSSPEFIQAFSQANKITADVNQMQKEYNNLGVFSYIIAERSYVSPQFFDILTRTSMEGCYSTGFVVSTDGSVTFNGMADTIAHVAMQENRLRMDQNIWGVAVSAIAQVNSDAEDATGPYSFGAIYSFDVLTWAQKAERLLDLGLIDESVAAAVIALPPGWEDIQLPEETT